MTFLFWLLCTLAVTFFIVSLITILKWGGKGYYLVDDLGVGVLWGFFGSNTDVKRNIDKEYGYIIGRGLWMAFLCSVLAKLIHFSFIW